VFVPDLVTALIALVQALRGFDDGAAA